MRNFGMSAMECLLGNLDTVSGTKSLLDVTVDGELTSSKTTNHEQTSRKTSEGTTEAELTSNLDETGDDALTRKTLGLVDLGKHSVSGLGDNGSSETSHKTRSQVDTSLSGVGELRLVEEGESSLRNLLESNELGDGVGDPVNSVLASPCCYFWRHARGVSVTYCLRRIGPNPL